MNYGMESRKTEIRYGPQPPPVKDARTAAGNRAAHGPQRNRSCRAQCKPFNEHFS